ncbi:aminopeptidase [Macrococcus equipercicus]|uniref:Aminopeptidase n=1 Tax=Macrococcus equipercicus TaxID=69967 RepID=A0ABQ6RAU6_9STAP|nr:aminopeptidase [Macrococcus equipercicus]KAA1042372.1 aminopeptidase [Macrococcus equipercicus]
MSQHHLLKKYADVIVKIGLNIQHNEILVIESDINTAPLVRPVVEAAYKQGAKKVIVNYSDSEVAKYTYDYQSVETLQEVPEYLKQELKYYEEEKAALLSIVSVSPEALKNQSEEKINARAKVMMKAHESLSDSFGNFRQTWCIVAYPSVEWAEIVFPELSGEAAQNALFDAIFKAVRADQENPVAAWKSHIEHLNQRANWLTEKGFDKLHYTAPGTDLTVGLHQGGNWLKAGKVNKQGTEIIVNMPTEEVYTTPDFRRVDGYVSNTLPLSLSGKIVDQFKLTFKDGVVTDFEAGEGYETLKNLLEIDDGAKRLGEIALVPVNSPIYESGLLFYNTLFDENASCHIALGSGFAEVINGAEDQSIEEQVALGINDSLTHVDFMIGSESLDIDGVYADDRCEPIFRQGRWVE